MTMVSVLLLPERSRDHKSHDKVEDTTEHPGRLRVSVTKIDMRSNGRGISSFQEGRSEREHI